MFNVVVKILHYLLCLYFFFKNLVYKYQDYSKLKNFLVIFFLNSLEKYHSTSYLIVKKHYLNSLSHRFQQ